jgi:hypothetical protein
VRIADAYCLLSRTNTQDPACAAANATPAGVALNGRPKFMVLAIVQVANRTTFVHVIMPSQRPEKRREIGNLLGLELKPAWMPLLLKHIFNRPCTAVVQ